MTEEYQEDDYPDGDGHPDCALCHGRGAVDHMPFGALVPGIRNCECVLTRDTLLNLDRGWRQLSNSTSIGRTPLLKYVEENLWVTSRPKLFRRHMHKTGFNQGPHWNFRVHSDADLMDAWLSRIDAEEIIDADVSRIRQTRVSHRYPALVDLVEPPGLLVIRLGVKAAKNREMPAVFLEAVQHRLHLAKPTWVVDSPAYRLDDAHIAWNERVDELLDDWPHIELGKKRKRPPGSS